MSHTLSAPLLSRLSSLSAELSELCGLCDLLADPMPRNFIQPEGVARRFLIFMDTFLDSSGPSR